MVFAAALLEAAAAVFIAVSFGGGVAVFSSSLSSLLLSGLNILFVLTNFFWASVFGAVLLTSLGAALCTACVCFETGTGFLLVGFVAGLAVLATGVTVAEALGLVGGFLLDFELASSDSEE